MARKTVFILLTVALVMGLIGGSVSVAQEGNEMYYACVNLKGVGRFVSGCNKCYTSMSERCYVWEAGGDEYYTTTASGWVSGCLGEGGSAAQVTAYCDAGDQVTGGGFILPETGEGLDVRVMSSQAVTDYPEGWAVRATKWSYCGDDVYITAQAVCADTGYGGNGGPY